MKAEKKQRSLIVIIVSLAFSVFSVMFFYLAVWPDLQYGWQVRSWNSTHATLLSAKLKRHYGDSTTYEALAEYEYQVNGIVYRSNRVAISEGADNIGDFQETLSAQLERKLNRQQPITIWYNKANPSDSIINRDIRWGLMSFKLIFVTIFGFIGFGLLIASIKGFKSKTKIQLAEPWLKRSQWVNGAIKSNAKKGMLGFWFFTVFWNTISFPAAIFAIPKILANEEYAGLFVLLFPIVGLGLLYWVIKLTLEWKRFGVTPLSMDPYPGSIDGQVGGTIQVQTPYNPKLIYKVTLSCIHSYISGSGKNRSRTESIKWQDDGYAQVKPKAKGIELEFCFNVPAQLPFSQELSDSYYLWRLFVESEMEGIDLNRSFEIPVYNSGQKSRLNFLSSELQPLGVVKETAESLLPISNINPTEIYYPLFRKAWQHLVGVLLGGIFAGVGLFMWGKAAEEGGVLYFMAFIFSLVGFGIMLASIYALLNSLRLRLDGTSLSYQRKLLWFSITKVVIPYSGIKTVSYTKGASSTSSNGKHRVAYTIYIEWKHKKYTIAEDISSASKKDLVIDYFKREFRLI